MPLYNTLDRNELLKKIAGESFSRITLSFYRYVQLNDVEQLRARVFKEWQLLGILGRIYIAREGVNA